MCPSKIQSFGCRLLFFHRFKVLAPSWVKHINLLTPCHGKILCWVALGWFHKSNVWTIFCKLFCFLATWPDCADFQILPKIFCLHCTHPINEKDNNAIVNCKMGRTFSWRLLPHTSIYIELLIRVYLGHDDNVVNIFQETSNHQTM